MHIYSALKSPVVNLHLTPEIYALASKLEQFGLKPILVTRASDRP